MSISIDSLRDQIPYYLTQPQEKGLVRALKQFPENTSYYLYGKYQNEVLQGDGWTKLKARRFATGEKISILGIIVSNSCDISEDNKRDFPPLISFAPLITLQSYIKALEDGGIERDQISSKIVSIKKQKITNIFFLPAGNGLKEEYIALLGQIYTMPVRAFEEEKEKSKQFTLSMVGFYLFLFKLSIHFCRFHENVDRS